MSSIPSRLPRKDRMAMRHVIYLHKGSIISSKPDFSEWTSKDHFFLR